MRLATVIEAARSRFATKAPISPMAPIDANVQSQCRPTAIASLETPLTKLSLFTRSPLPVETNPALIDQIDIIFRDESVQRAAGACAAKRLRLTELAGFKAETSAAIQIAIANDEDLDITNITPAVVAEVLRQRAEDIDDAIADCQEDRAQHDAASRKRMARHAPLRAAASERLTLLTNERARLIQDDEAAARAASMGLPTRYSILISAGMTETQIEVTEPTAAKPEILTQRRHARIAAIAVDVQRLNTFMASPTFDAAAIVGIDPAIDAAIVARDGALPAEVA